MSVKKPEVFENNAKPKDSETMLRSAPPGSWVALSADRTRVVGTGISAKAATYQAKLHGEHSPVLIQTPTEEQALAAAAK